MQKEQCPLCGEWNATTSTHCQRCRYRLPWADALEGVPPEPPPSETKLERELQTMGLLPSQVHCRYCNQTIGVHDKQCPHCKQWLTSRNILWRMGSSESSLKKKDFDQVDTIGPYTSFGTALLTLFYGIALLAVLAAVGWLLVKIVP